MSDFTFSRLDAEQHFQVVISEDDWQVIEEGVMGMGDFGIRFTTCSGSLRYEFDNADVLEQIDYAKSEQIPLESELEKFTYTHWSDIENFWETEIELAVIDAVREELKIIGKISDPYLDTIETDPGSGTSDEPISDESPF